jgi:RNA polymerase sigma-70 factor (ECF subfamily)
MTPSRAPAWPSPRLARVAFFAIDSLGVDVPAGEVTQLLQEINQGDQTSVPELYTLIYHDLRRLAAGFMRRERPDHTLQATDLVHEVYVRLYHGVPFQWENRKQLFGCMAYLMRNMLVDHARKHGAEKRGGEFQNLPLDEALIASDERPVEVLALNEALEGLARVDERAARVVELRYYVGLTVEETAAMLELSPETVKNDWRFAKNWLTTRLNPD